MVTYEPQTVSISSLLLDPNNYRFSRPERTREVNEVRFSDETVQEHAQEAIIRDGITELKNSISENGFIPVERIVVRPWRFGEGKFVVLEGNRRTTALKELQKETLTGIDFPVDLTPVFESVPVLVAEGVTREDELAIMGIRHVGGPKPWGGYQSAELIHKLMSAEGTTPREVASRLGLTVNEVNRRYRSFSALLQMSADEDFGDSVTNDMYPVFHEAVGQPRVREWLGWDQQSRIFKEDANRNQFYEWIAGTSDTEPKITKYSEVRELKGIIDNEDALATLKEEDSTFSDALAILKSQVKSSQWSAAVKAALEALVTMGQDTISNLTDADVQKLADLRKKAAWVIQAQKQLVGDFNDED